MKTMTLPEAYVLVWADTQLPIPPIDDDRDLMVFSDLRAALQSAERQTGLYGDDQQAEVRQLLISPREVPPRTAGKVGIWSE